MTMHRLEVRTNDDGMAVILLEMQSAADVLSPTAAAKRLPMANSDALAWMRCSGLVHEIEGRRFVIWGDVLDFIRDPTGGGMRFLDPPVRP